VSSTGIPDDDRFRISLNGTETHRTLAGSSFLARGPGATVRHIALATDDIFATAKALRAAGFPVLPISPTYFDDLAARFDIEPDTMARMRAENILYDADETENSSNCVRSLSPGRCSLKLSRGVAIIRAMAHQMRPSGLPPRSGFRGQRGCPYPERPKTKRKCRTFYIIYYKQSWKIGHFRPPS
jgi:hypothetical protein